MLTAFICPGPCEEVVLRAVGLVKVCILGAALALELLGTLLDAAPKPSLLAVIGAAKISLGPDLAASVAAFLTAAVSGLRCMKYKAHTMFGNSLHDLKQ